MKPTKILYYDLETTGTKFWRNGIHQMSGLVEIDGNVVAEFDFKVQPFHKAEIEDEALAVANINRDTLKDYMPFSVCYGRLIDLLSKHIDRFDRRDKMFLCGYNNASFDDQFLRAFFVQNGDQYFGSYFFSGSLDVMVLAANHLIATRHSMANFKLSTVAEHFGIEVENDKLHDATYDLYLTRSILEKINKKEHGA